SFSGDDNHNGSSDSKDFTISKASSTTTITISDAIYDGSPHGGTANVTGAGGLSQSVAVNYAGVPPTSYGPSTSAPTNAGTYRARAIFSGDDNHTGSQDSTDFSIAKAASTTTVTAPNATYGGNLHGATATVSGAGIVTATATLSYSGRNSTSYGPSATAPSNAGDYTASATTTGDANHTGSSGSADYAIAKAPTSVAWDAPNILTKVY